MLQQYTKMFLGRLGLLSFAEGLVHTVKQVTPAGRDLAAHQRKTIAFYKQFIVAGTVCFDVGANYGERSEIFARLGARVIAVDPQPLCVNYLQARFAHNPKVTVVPKGLDAAAGEQELLINSTTALVASMSKEWVSRVAHRPRYAPEQWNKSVKVQVTTLDELIKQHGKPTFCKIDVEGYELNVLRGLTRPINALSFEFTPESIQAALDCVGYLDSLANHYVYNYSVGETMELVKPEWVNGATIHDVLLNLPSGVESGDVYAKLTQSGNNQ
jgi:FkbM family methyltransferase